MKGKGPIANLAKPVVPKKAPVKKALPVPPKKEPEVKKPTDEELAAEAAKV